MSLQAQRPGTPWHVQDLLGLDMLVAEAVVSKRWEMSCRKKQTRPRRAGLSLGQGLILRLMRNRKFPIREWLSSLLCKCYRPCPNVIAFVILLVREFSASHKIKVKALGDIYKAEYNLTPAAL